MISQLIDEVEDEYQDYYYAMKEVLRTKGISLSFDVRMFGFRGLSGVNMEQGMVSQVRQFKTVFELFQSVLYCEHSPSQMLLKKFGNIKNGLIPYFSDEEIEITVSLSPDFSNSVTSNFTYFASNDQKFLNPLISQFTGETQKLFVRAKCLNFGPDRARFESYYFSKEMLDQVLKEIHSTQILFIDDGSEEFEEKTLLTKTLASMIPLTQIPFNNILKAQCLFHYLDTYKYRSDRDFNRHKKAFEDLEFLKGYFVTIEFYNSFLSRLEKGETVDLPRPIYIEDYWSSF